MGTQFLLLLIFSLISIGLTIWFFVIFFKQKNNNNLQEKSIPIVKPQPDFSPGEAKAIIEQIENREKFFSHAKETINELLSSEWIEPYLEEAEADASLTAKTLRSTARSQVNYEINDRFYKKAAQAVFSKKSKRKLNEMSQEACSKIINPNSYREEVKNKNEEGRRRLLKIVKNKLEEVEAVKNDLRLSPEATIYLERLSKQEEKWKKALGGTEEFRKFMKLSKDPYFLGGVSLSIFGLIEMYALEEYGVELAIDIMTHMVLADPLAEIATEQIMEWISAEIGENAAAELLQIPLEILTGVGLILTGWRIIRYTKLVNRLFIKKEPLEKMRASILKGIEGQIDSMESQARKISRKNLEEYHDKLKIHLEELVKKFQEWIDHGNERKKWVSQFC